MSTVGSRIRYPAGSSTSPRKTAATSPSCTLVYPAPCPKIRTLPPDEPARGPQRKQGRRVKEAGNHPSAHEPPGIPTARTLPHPGSPHSRQPGRRDNTSSLPSPARRLKRPSQNRRGYLHCFERCIPCWWWISYARPWHTLAAFLALRLPRTAYSPRVRLRTDPARSSWAGFPKSSLTSKTLVQSRRRYSSHPGRLRLMHRIGATSFHLAQLLARGLGAGPRVAKARRLARTRASRSLARQRSRVQAFHSPRQ